MNEIKLDPICFKNQSMGVTNTGYLLPCCYCDDLPTLEDSEFQKLMAVSKIDDYETINEIIFSKEWKEFEENLRNHKGPPCCFHICRIREDKNNIVRKDIWINPHDLKIKDVRKI